MLKAWLDRNAGKLSFYSANEEFNLLKSTTQSRTSLWGLDQVFVLSDRLLFEKLLASSISEKARLAAEHALQIATAGYKTFSETGNGEATFMFTADSLMLANLKFSFADENAEIRKMIDDIILSSEIYKGWRKGSHEKRVQLMKHQLMDYLQKSAPEKILFKFGANHLLKGESYLTIYDLGNLVANLADAEYKRAFNILILGTKGMANTFVPIQNAAIRSFDVRSKDSDFNFLEPFIAHIDDQKWTLFNLVPIKQKIMDGSLQIENTNLRRTIVGYDAIVFIPSVTPSNPIK